MNIGDLVKINTFDDGNQEFKDKPNIWKIIEFKFNRSKSIIVNVNNADIKPRSISSWKLNKIENLHKPENKYTSISCNPE